MNITEDRLKYLEEQINDVFSFKKYEFEFNNDEYSHGDNIAFVMEGLEYTFKYQISPFMTLSYIGEALQKDGVIQNFRICGTTKAPWIEMLVRRNNEIY
jgi:hypothetical protein